MFRWTLFKLVTTSMTSQAILMIRNSNSCKRVKRNIRPHPKPMRVCLQGVNLPLSCLEQVSILFSKDQFLAFRSQHWLSRAQMWASIQECQTQITQKKMMSKIKMKMKKSIVSPATATILTFSLKLAWKSCWACLTLSGTARFRYESSKRNSESWKKQRKNCRNSR